MINIEAPIIDEMLQDLVLFIRNALSLRAEKEVMEKETNL